VSEWTRSGSKTWKFQQKKKEISRIATFAQAWCKTGYLHQMGAGFTGLAW
jgi:hypothetical protein